MSDATTARRVFVTGAGGGLGRAIAEHFARGGDRVVGTVRDEARAVALTVAAGQSGLPLEYWALDLASPASVQRCGRRLVDTGGVDILVHNAGFGVFGPIEEVESEAALRQFAVNLLGPLDLTRAALPTLRQRHGQVVWIGSLAGRVALPFQGHYSATKAAVAAVSDAMRLELQPHGVRVTCVEPGDFATGFTDARERAGGAGSPYQDVSARCLAAVEKQERGGPSPAWVARVVHQLSRLTDPPARRPVGQGARTMALLLRWLPDRVRERAVRWHYALKK